MMKKAMAVLAVLVLAMAARAADVPVRTVSTTGEATVYVVPDKVVVNFGVETYDVSLDRAKSLNEGGSVRLVKAILDLGIEKKDLATDNLMVEVKREYRDEHFGDVRGYTVRRGYAVTLKDVKLFEKFIDVALKNGANQIENVSFLTTDLRKYRDQARQMAIKAAKEKAVALAKELDCAVGKPQTISENGGFVYFGGYRWSGGRGAMSQNAVQMVSGPADTSENLPLGQIAINASVAVAFDLQ